MGERENKHNVEAVQHSAFKDVLLLSHFLRPEISKSPKATHRHTKNIKGAPHPRELPRIVKPKNMGVSMVCRGPGLFRVGSKFSSGDIMYILNSLQIRDE